MTIRKLYCLAVVAFVFSLTIRLCEAASSFDKGKEFLETIEPDFLGKPIYLNTDQKFKEEIEKKLLLAVENLNSALLEGPNNPQVLFLLGKAYSFAHDLDVSGAWHKSTEYLKRCIELDSAYVEAHLYLGKNYMDAERFDEAYEIYKTAYGLAPNSEAEKFMAAALMFQNKIPEAITILKRYVSTHPKDHDAPKMLQSLEEGRYSKEVTSSR